MNGLIEWFADNPIAANLLMLIILAGGLSGLDSISKEMFPTVRQDKVRVTVAYPGAGPREVEKQICLRIEDSLDGLQGIEETRCVARLGAATAEIEAASGYPLSRLLNAVKSRVDSINTLPQEAERPVIEELPTRQRVISLAISSSSASERDLKEYTEQLKEELSALPEVPLVQILGTRDYEISVEIAETTLRKYGLTFADVAGAIRRHSLDQGAGLIRTNSGDIQIQTRNQSYSAADFAAIPLISTAKGTRILLGDVAEIRDGFVDDPVLREFNGHPAAFLQVDVSDNPNILRTAERVRDFVEARQSSGTAGYDIAVWTDSSKYFRARMDTLKRSALGGLALVFLILMLFLRPALAMWVACGIAVAFVGALFLLPLTGTSINVATLFAFILVLGIVVDDAIIIGENIHRVQQRGTWGVAGAKIGAKEMAKPVFFAVSTSIVVFIPMLLLPGDFARMTAPMAIVPILALLFSLLESCLILPSHLAGLQPERPSRYFAWLDRLREQVARGLRLFLVRCYRPFLRRCIRRSGTTVAVFLGLLIIALATLPAGIAKIRLSPNVPVEYIRTTVILPQGTPFDELRRVAGHVRDAARRADELLSAQESEPVLQNYYISGSGNSITVLAELSPPEVRRSASADFVREWRREMGPLPEAEELDTVGRIAFSKGDIEYRLSGQDIDRLRAAAGWIQQTLAAYPGMGNVRDSLAAGRPEMEIEARPSIENFGVGLNEISRQLRQAFYGEEAQRVPRGREDVKVMVRYPDDDRRSTVSLDEFRVRTADGREVPLNALADTNFREGFADITRINGAISITVSAEFIDAGMPILDIVRDIEQRTITEFDVLFPDIALTLEGEQKDNQEFNGALQRLGGLAILAVFGLLAIQFRSWLQPLLVISAIPFSIAGAIIAHSMLGRPVSMISWIGMLAAAGVVVNDTLVFIDRVNGLRNGGFSVTHALVQAGRDRFRPIFLTSMTTFFGLTPIMLEKSTQAQFLIPMAISLAFGVLTATVISLVFLPALYALGHDLRHRAARQPRSAVAPAGVGAEA